MLYKTIKYRNDNWVLNEKSYPKELKEFYSQTEQTFYLFLVPKQLRQNTQTKIRSDLLKLYSKSDPIPC